MGLYNKLGTAAVTDDADLVLQVLDSVLQVSETLRDRLATELQQVPNSRWYHSNERLSMELEFPLMAVNPDLSKKAAVDSLLTISIWRALVFILKNNTT